MIECHSPYGVELGKDQIHVAAVGRHARRAGFWRRPSRLGGVDRIGPAHDLERVATEQVRIDADAIRLKGEHDARKWLEIVVACAPAEGEALGKGEVECRDIGSHVYGARCWIGITILGGGDSVASRYKHQGVSARGIGPGTHASRGGADPHALHGRIVIITHSAADAETMREREVDIGAIGGSRHFLGWRADIAGLDGGQSEDGLDSHVYREGVCAARVREGRVTARFSKYPGVLDRARSLFAHDALDGVRCCAGDD